MRIICSICLLSIFVVGDFASAQSRDKYTFTVTPPLIKNNMAAGESWATTIKVVNNNDYPIDIYTQVADFKSGQNGGVEFLPEAEIVDNKYFLSRWMSIEDGPIKIEPSQSREIPFVIKTPADAQPGGHYAAILIGNQPSSNIEGSGMQISSMMASLILVTIKGDIKESARIREFYVGKELITKPEADFHVSLENTGNVHVLPKGEVTIYDFFGKKQSTLPINLDSDFGNVLPESLKKWDLRWTGDGGLFKMGRHRAVLTLVYGEVSRETLDQAVYFWYIDFKILGLIVSSILGLLFLVVWLVKRSIRQAILAANINAAVQPATKGIVKKNSVIDLQSRVIAPPAIQPQAKSSFLAGIVAVIFVLAAVILGIMLFLDYKQSPVVEKIQNTQTEDKSQEVRIIDDK